MHFVYLILMLVKQLKINEYDNHSIMVKKCAKMRKRFPKTSENCGHKKVEVMPNFAKQSYRPH